MNAEACLCTDFLQRGEMLHAADRALLRRPAALDTNHSSANPGGLRQRLLGLSFLTCNMEGRLHLTENTVRRRGSNMWNATGAEFSISTPFPMKAILEKPCFIERKSHS